MAVRFHDSWCPYLAVYSPVLHLILFHELTGTTGHPGPIDNTWLGCKHLGSDMYHDAEI